MAPRLQLDIRRPKLDLTASATFVRLNGQFTADGLRDIANLMDAEGAKLSS